jgi:adenylyltransferase/sulfurtransferase
MTAAPIVTAEEASRIGLQALEEYPNECCGVIMVRGGERSFLRFRNVQDDLHRRDPERHPRTARTAYHIGKPDLDRMVEHEEQGFRLAVIYHSHPDAGAYFSETDKRVAMLGRDPSEHEPLYPSVVYVVVSVRAGQVDDMGGFRWDGAARDFVAVDLGICDVERRAGA